MNGDDERRTNIESAHYKAMMQASAPTIRARAEVLSELFEIDELEGLRMAWMQDVAMSIVEKMVKRLYEVGALGQPPEDLPPGPRVYTP